MNAHVARILIHAAAALAMLAIALSPAQAAGALVPPDTRSPIALDEEDPSFADDGNAARTPVIAPFEGLTLFVDTALGYQLWLPAGWIVAESEATDGSASLVIAKPGAPDVNFSITSRTIAAPMTLDDLPAMTAEFEYLRDAVPGSSTEWQARWHRGAVRGFEAMTTVKGGDPEPVRWLCLRYQGTRQYWMVATAPSGGAFDADMFAFLVMMHSFRVR